MKFTTLTTVFLLALGAGVAGQDSSLPGESDTGSFTIEPTLSESSATDPISVTESSISDISSLPEDTSTTETSLPPSSTSRSVSSTSSASTSRSSPPSPTKSGPSETVTAPPNSGALVGVTIEFGGIAVGVLGIVAAIL